MYIPKTEFLSIISQRKSSSSESFSLRKHGTHIISPHHWILHSPCDPLMSTKKRKCLKNAQGSPMVYLLFFFIFLLAHCDLGDGWFRTRMMSSCCQTNCIDKEELACSPFRMIDSMAPHPSSGSSWPALLSPPQGDLGSTACALPALEAAWRLSMRAVG